MTLAVVSSQGLKSGKASICLVRVQRKDADDSLLGGTVTQGKRVEKYSKPRSEEEKMTGGLLLKRIHNRLTLRHIRHQGGGYALLR
jgi:hypothetical protein